LLSVVTLLSAVICLLSGAGSHNQQYSVMILGDGMSHVNVSKATNMQGLGVPEAELVCLL